MTDPAGPGLPSGPTAGIPAVWTLRAVAAALDSPAVSDLPVYAEVAAKYPNLNLNGGTRA